MKAAAIFSLACRHSYYADGVCTDFATAPTEDTQRLLRNQRCQLGSRADGVLCSVELGDNGSPLIAFDPAAKLAFNLILQYPEFGLITDLTAIAAQSAPLFVPAGNPADGGSLTLTSRDQPLDTGVFAAVELPGSIFNNPPAQQVQYFIDFQAKQARWLYYCVTDLKLTGKDIRVVDLGTDGNPLVFSPANRTDLGQNPDPNDALASELADRYPDLNRVRFASDASIPCQETPRRLSLQLDGHNFPDVLPAPALQNCTVYPFTQQGDVSPQSALYQVAKYVSYSFPKDGV